MIPADLRNVTLEQIQPYLVGQRRRVLDAWRRWTEIRGYTTAVVAESSGISILNLRPRTTELVQLGLVKLIGRQGGEGIYQAVPAWEARAYEAAAASAPSAHQMPLPFSHSETLQSAIRNPQSAMQKVPIHPPRNNRPTTVEVAPGKSVVDAPAAEVRRIGVCDLVPQGDGTYKPVLRIHAQEVKLSPHTLRELGIGISIETMRRLIRAGFVQGARSAPNAYFFTLQSYFDHVERVRAAASVGDDFWTTENLTLYRTVT
jgi:hypothetical protein